MNKKYQRPGLATLGLLASSLPAWAHPGHGAGFSFMHGFTHPFSGADHVLAMTAVGLLAAAIGGRALWAVPASFLAMMLFGGILASSGIHLPLVELGISLSVVVLGLGVALRLPLPVLGAAAVAGFFAMFHGYAHGTEMPLAAGGLLYGAGFATATAVLMLVGVVAGRGVSRLATTNEGMFSRVAGGAIALAGVFLII